MSYLIHSSREDDSVLFCRGVWILLCCKYPCHPWEFETQAKSSFCPLPSSHNISAVGNRNNFLDPISLIYNHLLNYIHRRIQVISSRKPHWVCGGITVILEDLTMQLILALIWVNKFNHYIPLWNSVYKGLNYFPFLWLFFDILHHANTSKQDDSAVQHHLLNAKEIK